MPGQPSYLLVLLSLGLTGQPPRDPTLLSDHQRAGDTLRQCLADSTGRSRFRDYEPFAASDPRNHNHLVAVWGTSGGGRGVLQSAVSDDGGRSWTAPTVVPTQQCGGGPRQAARASDPWVSIAPNGTVDGGRTWSPLTAIGPALGGGRVSAPTPMVDRRGVVRLFYFRGSGRGRLVGMMASTDRGASWQPEVTVAPLVAGPFELPHPTTGEDFVFAIDIVQVAHDTRRDRWYLAYADAHRQPGGPNGVSLVWSDDGGATWSRPIAVSLPGPGQAWLPALAVDTSGTVGVGYLRASFEKSSQPPTAEYRLASFRPTSTAVTKIDDQLLETSELVWPGDYHTLIAGPRGFQLLTGRAPLTPAAPDSTTINPTDIALLAPPR